MKGYANIWALYLKLRVMILLSRRLLGRRSKALVNPDCVLRVFGHHDQEVFFGYYDVTPFSPDERYLLAMRKPFARGQKAPGTSIAVGYYSLEDDDPQFEEIGTTTTWCWQQGCRLQWFPHDKNRLILFNQLVNGKHGAVIKDIESKKIEQQYSRAIYSLSKDGKVGISLNFARLQRLRPGYGYDNLTDETTEEQCPEYDGLWSVDMATGKIELILTVSQIAQINPQKTMVGAVHYFNHVLWNPSSTRIMFFHLWLKKGKRRARLITVDKDGGQPYVLYNEDQVSHYCWLNENELIAFSTHPSTGGHYHHYRDKEGLIGVVGKNILTEDGHPSVKPELRKMLTDTYPDKRLERKLLLYDLVTTDMVILGSFFSPTTFMGEYRCDLHPRWSPSGRMLCIDSAHNGVRQQCVIEIKNN